MQDFVREYYGKVLNTKKDLKTSACTSIARPPPHILSALEIVPEEIKSKFYGCGCPIPVELEGLTVLDLGCGTGRDCYIAAQFVGAKGKVIGIDMTDEQLDVAKKYEESFCKESLGYPASVFEFKKGFIELIEEAGVAKNSVDLVISNCVINLSVDKGAVLQGAANVLKEGGELYFSDVYCDRRLPEKVRKHEVLWGECIAGALYIEDFKRMARLAGFEDCRMLSMTQIRVSDPQLSKIVGEAKFYSILFRCFKLKNLESLCEDFGQVATYIGGIPFSDHFYDLDDHHHFSLNKPMLVCGNTAEMLQGTRLAPYFRVQGDRSTHFGLFPCGTSKTVPQTETSKADDDAGCCSGGSCC